MPSLSRFNLTLAAVVALFSLSGTAHAIATCKWDNGIPGPLLFSSDLGSFMVPRDAEIGSKIGSITRRPLTSQGGVMLLCDNDGSKKLMATITTPLTLAPGSFPPVDAIDVTGKVLQTNVPGVGLYVQFAEPLNGPANNMFHAEDGGMGAVPFTAINYERMTPTSMRMTNLNIKYAALIKTGPIPPGPQTFNQIVATGTITDITGDAITLQLSGRVQQAQCSLKADAVSADPVLLGNHDIADFKGVGTTTAAVDFYITLSDCEDDPSNSVARAFIRLDGVQGSVPVDRDLGLFTLTTDSTASGLGIQILRSDSTPLKLEEFVQMTDALTPGPMRIDLRARYYQTDGNVTPGVAKGALNFTMNYR